MQTLAVQRSRKLAVLLFVLVSIGWGMGCGLGTYDDLGQPVPGERWPWVCPESGEPILDGGCPRAASTDAAIEDNAPDTAIAGAS